ncbi:MAG: autotransporter strand-loop-strand O-heptosyltransferase [Lachnospiraceae bacterium]|nr:autotransporter strand-loop-strand O-heptosyltransferase [Lachnospiraceae bacterium]
METAGNEFTSSAESPREKDDFKEKNKHYDPGPVVRETGIPGIRMDFNNGFRLSLPEKGNYHVRVTDQDYMVVLMDADVSESFICLNKRYYINYLVELWKDGRKILMHHFSLAGKNVRIPFPVGGGLGDVLAWFPYAEEFRRKHGCNMYCIMPQIHSEILRPAYPDIIFLTPDQKVPDCYASYYTGAYTDNSYLPIEHRQSGLSRSISYMLGLGGREVRPVLTPCVERLIREPYVCIAAQSTGQRKYWNNPRGWTETVDYLKSLGYRVLCIDRERSHTICGRENVMPPNAEDFTGDLPLQRRIDLLGHADFFIGLSSGLSWLAWGAGTPVVLISGFTFPSYEFYTPYRVINPLVCNSCWNDRNVEMNPPDGLYCPRHKGTDRMFECSRFITPEQVIKTIDRLMADHGLPRRRV